MWRRAYIFINAHALFLERKRNSWFRKHLMFRIRRGLMFKNLHWKVISNDQFFLLKAEQRPSQSLQLLTWEWCRIHTHQISLIAHLSWGLLEPYIRGYQPYSFYEIRQWASLRISSSLCYALKGLQPLQQAQSLLNMHPTCCQAANHHASTITQQA